jgi:dUTP pyrophosphatase
MKIKIKKLHPYAAIPSYAKLEDAGMDLTCTDINYSEKYISYRTGLAFEIPEGYVGLLFPRSSNSKKDLLLCNSVGVLDSGYRGEVEFRYKYVAHGNIPGEVRLNSENTYNTGDRIGQIIIIPYPQIEFEEVEELSVTERGEGGFGSTNI